MTAEIRDWRGISDFTAEEVGGYGNRWFIAHYLKENYGEFYTYPPIEFKNSNEILVRGSALVMYNTKKQMLEFKEYGDKVYWCIG